MRATTPMSCVTSSIAVPSRVRRSASRSRICAWMVTSSAVVGSSASTKAGSHSKARAMQTRCFIPPLISCGYWRIRSRGLDSPTSWNRSATRDTVSLRETRLCTRNISASCAPTVISGFSECAGFWNTMAMRLPRSFAIAASGKASRSCPSKRMRPPEIVPGRGISRNTARLDIVLPLPLSPTRPSTSCGATAKSTPSTACSDPPSVSNRMRRSSTVSSVTPAASG